MSSSLLDSLTTDPIHKKRNHFWEPEISADTSYLSLSSRTRSCGTSAPFWTSAISKRTRLLRYLESLRRHCVLLTAFENSILRHVGNFLDISYFEGNKSSSAPQRPTQILNISDSSRELFIAAFKQISGHQSSHGTIVYLYTSKAYAGTASSRFFRRYCFSNQLRQSSLSEVASLLECSKSLRRSSISEMCLRIGVEWKCDHQWTGYIVCSNILCKKRYKVTHGTQPAPYLWNSITPTEREQQYVLKLTWCCGPACCQRHIGDVEAAFNTYPNQQQARTAYKNTVLEAQGHLEKLMLGLGKLNSMRSGPPTQDVCPAIDRSYLDEITRRDLDWALIQTRYQNAIATGSDPQKRQPVARDPVAQHRVLRDYILLHPQFSRPQWKPSQEAIDEARRRQAQGPAVQPVIAGPSNTQLMIAGPSNQAVREFQAQAAAGRGRGSASPAPSSNSTSSNSISSGSATVESQLSKLQEEHRAARALLELPKPIPLPQLNALTAQLDAMINRLRADKPLRELAGFMQPQDVCKFYAQRGTLYNYLAQKAGWIDKVLTEQQRCNIPPQYSTASFDKLLLKVYGFHTAVKELEAQHRQWFQNLPPDTQRSVTAGIERFRRERAAGGGA